MPRSNRPRASGRGGSDEDDDLTRLLTGWRKTEVRRGGTWNVQPIVETQAVKEYTCPGCVKTIEAGVAHVVAWRADGVLGDARDLADRRHWHNACWRLS